MSEHERPLDFPYVINDAGEVVGVLRTYRTLGGQEIGVFIPDPAGPADGWGPGQRETYMAALDKHAFTEVKKAVRQMFGQKSVWLAREEPVTQPLGAVADSHMAMLRREGDLPA